jgi:hypothetical protein
MCRRQLDRAPKTAFGLLRQSAFQAESASIVQHIRVLRGEFERPEVMTFRTFEQPLELKDRR